MNKPGNRSVATFVRGIALTSKHALVSWLAAQRFDGQPRLIRLPLVLARDRGTFDLSRARIGSGADPLEVYANDASLGVGLADRATRACVGTEVVSCAFLVEGYWRGEQHGGFELDVKKAEVLPTERLAGVTFAEVEGESGN
jgi:hypothetical protein